MKKLMQIKINALIDEKDLSNLRNNIKDVLSKICDYHHENYYTKTNFGNKITIDGMTFGSGFVFKKKFDNTDIFVVHSVGTRYIKVLKVGEKLLQQILKKQNSDDFGEIISHVYKDKLEIYFFTIINKNQALLDFGDERIENLISKKVLTDETAQNYSITKEIVLDDCGVINEIMLEYLCELANS